MRFALIGLHVVRWRLFVPLVGDKSRARCVLLCGGRCVARCRFSLVVVVLGVALLRFVAGYARVAWALRFGVARCLPVVVRAVLFLCVVHMF